MVMASKEAPVLLSLPSGLETRAAINHSLGKRAVLISNLKVGATGGKR